MDADFGAAQWVFGQSMYAFVKDDIVCVYTRNARRTWAGFRGFLPRSKRSTRVHGHG